MGTSQVARSYGLRIRHYALASLVLSVACGRGKSRPEPKSEGDDAGLSVVAPELVKGKAPAPAAPPAVFADGGDEERALLSLGALPAWSGVLERFRLLSRRDQSGVVSGLLVEVDGGLRLVDESEGAGSLSIPVKIPASIALAPPTRVVLWGAWHVDERNEFVWQATRVEALAASHPSPEFAPGLEARDKEASESLVAASAASKRGAEIFFVVVEQPERFGDGWLIADAPEGAAVARLLLPGERPIYGDQTRVTESERWQLRKNSFYWLEIGRFRPATDGTLPVYRAITPPFRYSPPPAESTP